MTYKEAGEIVRGIIHSYIGPDHKVLNMQGLYGAMVQALQQAHMQGWKDHAEADKLSKH